jgi:hypothetical protein
MTSNAGAAPRTDGGAATTTGFALVRDTGKDSQTVYELNAPTTTIGSGIDAGIRLLSCHVSSRHATVTVADGAVTVQDDGSTAGTRIGETGVTEATPLPLGAKLVVGDVTLLLEASEGTGASGTAPGAGTAIAGVQALRGVMLYGATLLFAGIYAYFIDEILGAPAGHPPVFDSSIVAVAAALAGVLGSAFALAIGVPTAKSQVNEGLREHLQKAAEGQASRTAAYTRRALSPQPTSQSAASWPMTAGIWVYGLVGGATFLTYLISTNETPAPVKALAIAFGGYAVALSSAAYVKGRSAA